MIKMVKTAKKARAEKILSGDVVGNMGFFLREGETSLPIEEQTRLAIERATAFMAAKE